MAALVAKPGGELPLENLVGDPAEIEPLRQAGRRLAIAGRLCMLQAGRVIDPRDLRGPVTVRLSSGERPR